MTNNTSYPQTTAEFLEVVAKIQDRPSYRKPILFALGSHVKTANGTLASVRYPFVNGPGQNAGSAAILINVLGIETEGVKNVMITPEQLAEVRKYFDPFRADGKKHLNLDVFDMVMIKMNGGRPLDDNYGFVVSFILVIVSLSQINSMLRRFLLNFQMLRGSVTSQWIQIQSIKP
jgi:Tetrahydrodipicolinate N-succinyltransferase N-terminal